MAVTVSILVSARLRKTFIKGAFHLKFCWYLEGLEEELEGKKLLERKKHWFYASKCHISDNIRAGVRPLILIPRISFEFT